MEREYANVKLETFLKLKKLEEKIMEGKMVVITKSKIGSKVSYFTESEAIKELAKEVQHLSDMNEALIISKNKTSSDSHKYETSLKERIDEILNTNKWISKKLTETEELYENCKAIHEEFEKKMKGMNWLQFREWKNQK